MAKDEQSFIARLGQSKMEKLQDLFTMTDKETGVSVFKTVGGNPFFMWWYIEGLCYGKQKVETFPKMSTLTKHIGKGETTIRGWLRKLENAKAIKRIPVFLKETGVQSSNLILVNAEFPDVPEGWDDVYKYGAIKDGKRFYPRENPDADTRQKPAGGLNQELYESDEVDETLLEVPGKNLLGSNQAPAKTCRVTRQKPAASPQATNPDLMRVENRFFEEEEEKTKKKRIDDDDIATWETDSDYIAYRERIMDGNGADIAVHSRHYSVFRELVDEVGTKDLFNMLDQYISVVANGEHTHKTPQAVWFLKGGWKNFDHRKTVKSRHSNLCKKGQEEYVPRSVQQSMEREAKGENPTPQSVDPETEARLQAKLNHLNQMLKDKKARQNA